MPKIFSAVNRGWVTCRMPAKKRRTPAPQKTNHFPTRNMMPSACCDRTASAAMDQWKDKQEQDDRGEVHEFPPDSSCKKYCGPLRPQGVGLRVPCRTRGRGRRP